MEFSLKLKTIDKYIHSFDLYAESVQQTLSNLSIRLTLTCFYSVFFSRNLARQNYS